MDDKKSLSFVILLITAFMFFLLSGQYIVINKLSESVPMTHFFLKLRPWWFVRVVYCLLVAITVYLQNNRTRRLNWVYENINYFILLTFALGILLTAGFTKFYVYNLIVWPILFLAYTVVCVLTIMCLRKGQLSSDKSIFGCSCEESDFYFDFATEEGTLRMHKPQQNFWLDGGPGSGKSASWIKGMISQCAARNYAGFIYDWEGDPTAKGSPILSKIAYGAIKHYKEKGECNLNFAFINFTDMLRTSRVNVFSEKYIPQTTAQMFIENVSTTLMKNLSPDWKEKMDFWGQSAVAFVSSVAYKCYKERNNYTYTEADGTTRPIRINTLPHVIAFCMSNYEESFAWLDEDEEIRLGMASILSAWRLGASQQTAGVVASAQNPMRKLLDRNIFWVLSPSEEEAVSLDITNKDNPTLLCVGNAPTIKEAVSPAISCIASVVMSQMNNPGKNKSVFMVDEFPTVNLQGIDVFIGTARKHYVATILALQDFNQAVRDYGEKSAKILKASCGNQAFGMTGNDNTSQEIEKLFGEMKQVQESFSEQDNGGGSRSESLQKEKIVKSREIAGQRAGHFIGKIVNGKPPFFNLQFKECTFFEDEIPLFSSIYETGDEKTDRELMNSVIDANYNRIISEVSQILSKYRKEPESNE